MKAYLKTYVIFYVCLYVSGSLLTSVVQLGQGKLRGVRSAFRQNRYFSIPYATSDRFQSPREPPKWRGILNAINPFVRCPQKISFFITGTEDCLYLDVYTPEQAKPKQKLPVMVFFHGGAYFKGSKELYDPQFLVMKDVIVVIVNYRLGVLGFLCLNGVSNLGLRDQVAALKWIKKNISAFGGDSDNVTLCGQSAGASSASLHLLSKHSTGLFHKMILMSGTALSTWAFNIEPLKPAMQDAQEIAYVSNEKEVYNTFAKAPLSALMYATHDTSVNPRYFKYSPCVDDNFPDPFFLNAPYEIFKSGNFNKVPVIIGYTDMEGAFFHRLLNDKLAKDLNDNFIDMLPCVFSSCSKEEKQNIERMIRSHYFGDKTINYKTSFIGLANYFSDWIAYGTINAFSKILSQYSDQPVFNYQFSYEGGRNFGKFISGFNFNGTTHAGELFYIFKPLGLSLPLLERDHRMINMFTTFISNFMKYGEPTPNTRNEQLHWPSANLNSSNILVIDEKMSLIDLPRKQQRGEFFLRMLCTFGKNGYVPCESEQLCTEENK
ncbi:juvenile hormone esterase-like [Danaus plexippus]|uniref:juvenile hormone esterase-like n=1 Tax=Danaus plexippus TaxID=13037 RepID=UPI002AB3280B|nr:juvenile hormone esterase-like [Danaus plexippus]